jgi:hypothetical protein
MLLLMAFSFCTFCTERKTKNDMLETYSILKATDLSDFSCWRIIERGERLHFAMYYEHKDSTSYRYTSSDSLLQMSKYRDIQFYLNEDLDSLYRINNDTTLQFDDGIDFLSHYSDRNTNELKSTIKSHYKIFKRLGLRKVFGYPWVNIYDFQLDRCIELTKAEGGARNEDFLLKSGYVKLDSNWYYLIESPCQ